MSSWRKKATTTSCTSRRCKILCRSHKSTQASPSFWRTLREKHFSSRSFPAPRSQIAHLKRQTGERSGELLCEKHFPSPSFADCSPQTGEGSGEDLREKHFPSRISNRFPNPAPFLENFWKNTRHLPVSPQFSTRFPNPTFILEIFWKTTCFSIILPQFSSIFPNPASFLEKYEKSTARRLLFYKRIGSNRLNQQFDPILLSVSCLTLGHLPAGRQISPPIRTCPPQETDQEPAQDTDPLLASMETVAPSVKSLVQFSQDRIAGISSAMATVAA